MRSVRFVAGAAMLAAVVLLCGDSVLSQDKKEAKAKGQLPKGWGDLGISAAQKEAIYKVQADYRDKIKKLNDEIDHLKTEQQKKMVALLTAEQRKKLQDSVVGESGEKEKKGK